MIRSLAAALATTTCIVALATPAAAQTRDYDIPAGSLRSALDRFARQSGRQVIYRDDVRSARSTGVKGARTADQALAAILAGTGFAARQDRSGALAIVKSGNDAAADRAASTGEADPGQEIVVTGTNIRGIRDLASPLTTYTRRDIAATGVGTTEDFVRTIPQNFNAGFTGDAAGPVYGGELSGNNYSGGSGVNLRGLGNAATLTLMDGHRIAGSGLGNTVDISLIPLLMIDRIDILTDGASAVYGTDAVGGVANFILRRDFTGAETSIRYGTVTSGGRQEFQLGQLLGTSWSSGAVNVGFDLTNRTPLSSLDRDFTQNLNGPSDILPRERKRSVLARVQQDISSTATVYASGLYGHRSTTLDYALTGGARETDFKKVTQIDLTAGATIRASDSWTINAEGTYDYNHAPTRYTNDGVLSSNTDFTNKLFAAKVVANGTVMELPAGALKAAIGAEYRRESYSSTGTLQGIAQPLHRSLYSIFGEAQVPIFGDSDTKNGTGLDLSLAGRYEHYSDFGSTTNPKVGLSWRIIKGLRLRGTYSTSFRAPSLSEQDVSTIQVAFVFPTPDPTVPSGSSNALYVFGGSDQLKPETAKQWTIGADIEPDFAPGLKLSVNYFNTRYKGLISQPLAALSNLFDVLNQETTYGAFVDRSPSSSLIQSFYANSRFVNPFGIAASDVTVFVDDRLANVAERKQQGLDASVSYEVTTSIGSLVLNGAFTRLISFTDRPAPSGPSVNVLNTVFHPVKFKGRGGVSWTNGGWAADLYANYVGAYHNNTVTPEERIPSWTTMDLNVGYTFPDDGSLSGLQVSLSATNIFDKDPPYISVPSLTEVNFDATNANALGRFVAIQLRKRW